MATSFDSVIDLALITVADYKLDKLYDLSVDSFRTYCDGFLVSAVPNFFQCQQSLNYNLEAREFDSDLTKIEVSILADFWAIEWFTREVRNSAQFQAKLQTTSSFKNHSEAQNIKEKSAFLDKLRERVYQKITDYQIENLSVDNLIY